MTRPPVLLPALFLALLAPAAAFAHAGHGTASLWAGLYHPVSGADHVLAMVAVGLWAGMAGGRFIWAAPAAFAGAMLLGWALAVSGVAVPGFEPVILASVIVLGAMVGLAVPLPAAVALPVIAVFGLMQGAAHGVEGPAAGLGFYAAGFALATGGLHLAGLAAGVALSGPGARVALRGLGAGTATLGAALALAG
ncbi:MAG: HupE/UreJ family protein [Rhodobacterales bacterium]